MLLILPTIRLAAGCIAINMVWSLLEGFGVLKVIALSSDLFKGGGSHGGVSGRK